MSPEERLRSLLDRAHERLAGDVDRTLADLVDGLFRIRAALAQRVWKMVVREVVPRHPLADAILASQLARRSRSKPRGELADAILLDMMYALPADTSGDELGDAIYAFEQNLASIVSCREACATMREHLTMLAAVRPDARTLALGCGHLREVDTTILTRFGEGARIVAVDEDVAAIASVRRRLIDPRVRTVCADPAMLASVARRTGRAFDLVYRIAPGTVESGDYWRDLVASAPALLRSGGTMLIALLADRRPDAGYLEACLDWWPSEHGREEVMALASASPEGADCTVTGDRHGVTMFVKLVREPSADNRKIGRYEDGRPLS